MRISNAVRSCWSRVLWHVPGIRTIRVAAICRRAAEGDLEARIVGVGGAGPFGKLCSAINAVLDLNDAFVRESSATMQECSQDRFHRPIVLRGMKGGYRLAAAAINSAGCKMRDASQNIDFVRSQAAANTEAVHHVASACKHLNSSSAEISDQTNQATLKTEEVVREMEALSRATIELAAATKRIEQIVNVINGVATQTHLLALNASIEAAHAGDMGQGFSVVANDVKSLARETRSATDTIADEMTRVRSTTSSVVDQIDRMRKALATVHDREAAIGVALKDQATAANEISQSISEVAKNTGEVSRRISREHLAPV